MTNMRRGFTMIELIFVIVIIGILAAVAIPKLAATRDDARISNIIANTRTVLGDFTSYYTAQGNDTWVNTATYEDASNVVLSSTACASPLTGALIDTTAAFCDEEAGSTCIEMDINSTSITVRTSGSTTDICLGVESDPAIIALTDGDGDGVGTDGKVHRLGGRAVQR